MVNLDAHVGAEDKEMYDDRFSLALLRWSLCLCCLLRSSVDPLARLQRGQSILSCTSLWKLHSYMPHEWMLLWPLNALALLCIDTWLQRWFRRQSALASCIWRLTRDTSQVGYAAISFLQALVVTLSDVAGVVVVEVHLLLLSSTSAPWRHPTFCTA